MAYRYLYPDLNAEMPEKKNVLEHTPNPASKEMIGRLEELGVETALDRFEAQQPQCGFGLRGLCCRMCQWGPCRIGPKSPRGICGRDLNMVVMSNIVRSLVAGLAGHGRHAHEVIMAIIASAEGKADLPLLGEARVWELAEKFKLEVAGKSFREMAEEVALVLLEDLGRLDDRPIRMLEAYAPVERKELWSRLGVLPRSATYEVMETLHMTTLGGCSDWTALAAQELRSALAYCYSTLFASSMATEILYGIPRPRPAQVNYGVMREDHVNILLHGHSPVMAEKVLEKINSPEIQALARQAGAGGIVVAGMCCTGDELLARYGVPTVTNILGQELALGTGAVDLLVADMQCVIPGVKTVADCFGTEVVTTCNSNRIPGATHIPFDAERPETLDEDALKVARLAVEAFARRDRSKVHIPKVVASAMAGWSYEAIVEAFGGVDRLLQLLKEGSIKGIATVVLSTVAAVRNVDPAYLKVAQNFGSSQRDILVKVVIPAAFPYITIGLHIALGAAWVFLVAGEMMGVRSGLGFLIIDARNQLRTELVVVGILVIGLLGLFLDRLIGYLEKKLNTRWGLEKYRYRAGEEG
ncbi:MAG: ABC transporter permease subunit [Firmicutes bacterium]|nr:ABC transporter permease subunit [Bacillota bacterium]